MNALRTIGRELVGLFVEDRLFALAIALWLLLAYVVSAYGIVPPIVRGFALFLGLATVLVAGVARGARTP